MHPAELQQFHAVIEAVYPGICRWAHTRFSSQHGKDYVHAALVKLLEKPVLLYEGAFYKLWKKRCIDVVRAEQGDTRYPHGKRLLSIPTGVHIDHFEEYREEQTIHTAEVRLDLAQYWSMFSAQEQHVLRAWASGHNLQDIAVQLGVSPGRISQIMYKAVPGFKSWHQQEYKPHRNRTISAEERVQMRERLAKVQRRAAKVRWERRQALRGHWRRRGQVF